MDSNGARDKKNWKIIENTAIFYEKFEKEMSDFVRCFVAFLVFSQNPIL